MARYIDADELKQRAYPFPCAIGVEYAVSVRQIDEQPTADVAEVKHAKWEINSDGYYPYCSNCMTEPKNGVMSKHCPECGALMDGGEEE